MYGDLAMIRRRVGQLREQAVDVRGTADRLVAQADGVDWHGRAAEALRARIHRRAEQLRGCAARHDTAADSLERHFGEVARLKERIVEIELDASARISAARDRIARIEAYDDPEGVQRVATPDDHRLADLVPPPPGHKDWLTLEITGQ